MSQVENGQNYHYVQDMLVKSVEFSKMLYEKTGFKNEFLETNAQKINVASSQFAHLLDSKIDSTVNKVQETTKTIAEKTNQTKTAFLERTNKTKKDLVQKTMNLSVVKKTEDLGNQLLSELEQQVENLTKSVNNKLSLPAESEQQKSSDEGKLTLSERSTRLLLTLNKLGKQIAEYYLTQAKSLSVVKSAQQKYAYVDLKTKEARATFESFFDVLFNTIITEHIINPLFSNLKIKQNKAKETVTVVIENIKKTDVKNLLAQAKGSYESLKQATIVAHKDGKLTFTFARETFKNSVGTIQAEVSQLLADVSTYRARVVEDTLKLYKSSIEEYKQKRATKLGQKAVTQEAPKKEEEVNGL